MRSSRVALLLFATCLAITSLVLALRGVPMRTWKRRRWALAFAGAGAIVVFFEIAEEVLERHIEPLDRSISLSIHRIDSPIADAAMRFFTVIGSASVVIPTVIVIAVWAWRSGDQRASRVLVGVAAFTELVNFLLKHAFERVRPSLFEEIATLHTYSFPSGHAMGSAAAYGTSALVAARLRPRARRALAIGAPTMILLIGLSRVFLGVHWPSDVLAGFAAGALITVAAAVALETTS